MPEQPLFFYDLGSPYAWLTAERIGDVLPVAARWRPVLLGGVFKAVGRSSWGTGPGRDEGMREIERRAARYGLPALRWPDPWPPDGLAAMRAATFAERSGFGREFALAAFRLAFVEGRDVADPDTLRDAATHAGGDADDLLAATARQDMKDELRAATEAAVALGVIGVPTVAVGGRLFWGDDRLEEAAAAPSGEQ
jgi:2-hydroxychromene-2-carboxylate isomerase